MRLLKSNRPSSAPTAHNADNQQQQVDGEDGQLKAAVAEELRELTQRIERNYLQSLWASLKKSIDAILNFYVLYIS